MRLFHWLIAGKGPKLQDNKKEIILRHGFWVGLAVSPRHSSVQVDIPEEDGQGLVNTNKSGVQWHLDFVWAYMDSWILFGLIYVFFLEVLGRKQLFFLMIYGVAPF